MDFFGVNKKWFADLQQGSQGDPGSRPLQDFEA